MFITAFALSPRSVDAQQLQAELASRRLYLGTATTLDVLIRGAAPASAPRVESVDGLRIDSPRRSVTRDLFRRTIRTRFQYRIAPERTGTFTIPAIRVRIGNRVQQRGPFTLVVIEAEVKFLSSRIDPARVVVNQVATLQVVYQGIHDGATLTVPALDGLEMSSPGRPRVELSGRTNIPISTYQLTVRPTRVGAFTISGVALDGIPANPVTLRAERFVVEGAKVDASSLVVGAQTTVFLFIRGLVYTPQLTLVTPSTIKAVPDRRRYRSPRGATVFPFVVTATEPGEAVIDQFILPDKRRYRLDEPIVITIRQAGAGGIFVCRGRPRKDETVVGEPFVVDYEVLYRGDLQAAAVDVSEAGFAQKDYIQIEPVNDLSYPDWTGRPIALRFGNGKLTALSGSGEVDGRKEQMIRFALKITPLATGELSLDGLRVILGIQVTERRTTAFSSFFSSRTERFARPAEVPLHRVIDPPGVTRPALYRGAVGAMTLETSLDRTTATAMAPMTLTLRITGEGVGAQLEPPPLAQVPELTRDFDVSPIVDAGKLTGSTIELTQTIRPRRADVKELPSLPLAYYDYKAGRYGIVRSLPIPLEIHPGGRVGAAAMQVVTATPAEPSSVGDAPSESDADTPIGLGANHATLGELAVTGPASVQAIAGTLVGGPLIVALTWLGRTVWRRRRPARREQRNARSLLASLDGLTDAPAVHEHIAATLQDYLRLRLDLPPGELSPSAVSASLAQHGRGTELGREIGDFLARCDAGRFGSSTRDPADRRELIDRARELMRHVDRAVQ